MIITAAELIAEGKIFHNSGYTFRGAPGPYRGLTGRLPCGNDMYASWLHGLSGAKYVIFSYGTPIAWQLTDNLWEVPNVKYSVTTCKHQNHANRIIHYLYTLAKV